MVSLPTSVPPQPSTREAILDAAEQRFADEGFAGASVRDIAGDAGLRNQASLYHYFRNKQQIYEAVLRRAVGELVPLWEGAGAAISAAAPGRRMAAAAVHLDAVLALLAERPQIARLIERAGIDEDRAARRTAARMLKPLYAAGIAVLEETGGRWQPSELPHLAAGLYHLIFGYFANAGLLEAVVGEDLHSEEMLARQRRFLAGAIARLLDINGAQDARPEAGEGVNA